MTPVMMPSVRSVKPTLAAVEPMSSTVVKEGRRWKTALNFLSRSSRSCQRYIALAAKAMKKAA
jgi:hypothetical protein